MGLQDVVIAGVTAQNTQVGVINSAFWLGDNVTSGLLGLAFPVLTKAFRGDERLEYDPVVTTMIKQGAIAPVFSLALDRNGDGGFLALGGIPPGNFSSEFASTPILIVLNLFLLLRSLRETLATLRSKTANSHIETDSTQSETGHRTFVLHHGSRRVHLLGRKPSLPYCQRH